jgi:hypothetical protein
MKHINTYKDFQKLDEKLSPSEKRSILFIPGAVLGFVGKKLFGIYPLLNTKWSELKRSTKGHKDSPFYTGEQSVIKYDLEKLSKDKLPSTSLKLGMFLRNWNIYVAKDYKSIGGGEHGKVGRDVVYISKDEIKKGDQVKAYRLNDRDIYSSDEFIPEVGKSGKKVLSKLKNPAELPMVIMVAKFDDVEKLKLIENYIDDICLEIEDELGVDVSVRFDIHGDHIHIGIPLVSKNIEYSSQLSNMIEENSKRIVDYLKLEGLNFRYRVVWSIKDPLYYYGNAGRFGTEIIPLAKEHSRGRDGDSDKPIWNRYFTSLDLSRTGESHIDKKINLTSRDLETLISDLENCKTSSSYLKDVERAGSDKMKLEILEKRYRVSGIPLKRIYIELTRKI